MHSSIHRPALATAAFHREAGPVRPRMHTAVATGDSTTLEVLCVRVGSCEYGLPVPQVEGLLHHQEGMVVLATGSDPGRSPVLLLDLADMLGREGATPVRGRAIVVVARAERRLGLVVDEVVGTKSVSSSQLRAATSTGRFADQHLLAVAQIDGHRIELLSADTWFALADTPFVVHA